MIRLIQPSQYHLYSDDLRAMFRLRKRIFHDRMQWPVTVTDDEEHDSFDALKPLYIIAKDDTGKVFGTARLLPTTGPNMLSDVFSHMLPDSKPVRSPLVWESSRFAVEEPEAAPRSAHGISRGTAELLAGIIEAGMMAGLEHIVSVVDVSIERVLRRAGCPCDRIGKPGRIGRSLTMVGLFEMTDELLSGVKAAGGIEGPVIVDTSDHPSRRVA
jgi:N-acyl-L-homoserine lactone synthetase